MGVKEKEKKKAVKKEKKKKKHKRERKKKKKRVFRAHTSLNWFCGFFFAFLFISITIPSHCLHHAFPFFFSDVLCSLCVVCSDVMCLFFFV